MQKTMKANKSSIHYNLLVYPGAKGESIMKKFKNYLLATTGLAILVLVPSTLSSESKSLANDIGAPVSTFAGLKGIDYLVHVTQMKAQHANDEALQGAEKQRNLVKQQTPQTTTRERAREKTVLQQLDANARRNAEILESVKLLATELKKLDCKCEPSKSRER